MDHTKDRKRNRLQGHNYSQNGLYFVTICTNNRLPTLGTISDGKMVLSKLGILSEKFILNSQFLPSGFEIDNFIIMPNHIHIIIFINDPNVCVGTGLVPVPKTRTTTRVVPTISQIVGSLKSKIVNKYIKQIERNHWPYFEGKIWQRSFHDRIIRNDHELENIREYISNNPINWDNDDYKL